jgi:hypothetical protein
MPPTKTPTDNFKDYVPRRKGQACHYAAHCPPSTCLREVLSVLVLLAKNNDFGFIYADVAGITKMCNGRYRKGGKKPYKQRAVEKALRIFVARQILSKKFAMELNGFQRTGRILNPHSSMTKRYPAACHFIGAGKTPGTWTPDGKYFADSQIASEFGVVVEAENAGAIAVASAGSRAVASAGASAVETEKLDGFSYGNEGGSKSLEGEASITVPEVERGALAAEGQTETSLNPINPVKPVSPLKKQITTNPATAAPNSNGKSQSTATAISTTELTDLTKEAAMALDVKTHFLADRVSSARDLFALLTDGELEFDNPTMRAYENTKGNGDFQCEELVRCCRDVLADNADKPLPNRRVLADLMHKSAARLRERHKRNVPKCWYRIVDSLRDGDPKISMLAGAEQTFDVTQHLRNYCNPYAHTWLHELFHNAVIETKSDLTPWEAQLVKYTLEAGDERKNYRDGWECMHALMLLDKEDGKEESPILVAVRDWLWTHDATHAKTDVPLWEPVAPSAR